MGTARGTAARGDRGGRADALTTSSSTSSGTLRRCSHSLKAEEWLKMTGAWDSRRAAFMVATDTWAKSMMTPSRFISFTTR